MEPTIIYIIIGVGALILGLIAGKLLFAKNTGKKIQDGEDGCPGSKFQAPGGAECFYCEGNQHCYQ